MQPISRAEAVRLANPCGLASEIVNHPDGYWDAVYKNEDGSVACVWHYAQTGWAFRFSKPLKGS